MEMPGNWISILSSEFPLCLALSATSLGIVVALQLYRNTAKNLALHSINSSPRKTLLPKLSADQVSRLPYSPDYFPGARDVETPYGSVRIYEFGPEDGRKVLFVPGISTPCLSLGGLAESLAKKGCRVMLFDLFGRGYTDNPTAQEHTAQLYTALILLVLASSPLSWTGTNAFTIIGYSLGGGIAASFTSTFPALVNSMVLVAPSGLLREKHIAWQSLLLYRTEGFLPERLVRYLVRLRLDSPSVPAEGEEHNLKPEDVLRAEAGEPKCRKRDISQVVDAAVQWQLENHDGFIGAFISSVRHAPITNQHASWARIGARLSAQKADLGNQKAQAEGMIGAKAVLVLGETDTIIVKAEIEEDAKTVLGKGNVEVLVFNAGHDIPISMPNELADALWKFWEFD